MPDVRRTRATLRSAEFGFLGVWVNTRVHTPRRRSEPFSAGVFDFSGFVSRPLRTSCWMVGKIVLDSVRVRRAGFRSVIGEWRAVAGKWDLGPTDEDSGPGQA